MKNENLAIGNSEKLILIGSLSTMLSAGIPILATIDSLLEEAKGGTKKILEAARGDLLEGKNLSVTFSRFPHVFNKVEVNIIRSSEESGTLDITLKDIKEQIKKEIEFNDKIVAALTYPTLVFFVFIGVILLILIVVIPKIALVFSRLKVTLPLPTRILIFVSNILLTYTIPLVLSLIVISLLIFLVYKRNKKLFVSILYSLPLISTLVKEIDLTRFSRSMHLLLTSGITITSALELAKDVVTKGEMGDAIEDAREALLGGKSLATAFNKRKHLFPNIMIKIVEAGEKTGSLEASMQDVSEYFDFRVTSTLKTLTTALEPIMLVIVGILVGGMMLSIIAPIYGLIGQISPK